MWLFEWSRSLLFCSGKEEESEKDCHSSLGEGGDTGELVPGKSLVFAAMELLVFILVRHLPQLNTRVKESPSHVPLRPQRLPKESARLVANTVSILAELPSLCSPAGEAWGKCTHTSSTHLRMYTYKRKSFNLLFQLECFIHHYYSLYGLHCSGLCMLMM